MSRRKRPREVGLISPRRTIRHSAELSLAHFYLLFREHYGTTPRRYRLGHQSIIGE